MKCASAQNLLNAISPIPKLCSLLGDSDRSNNHLRHLDSKKSSGNNLLGHKSLTRTRSAPLKQSKDDNTGICFGFNSHHFEKIRRINTNF